MNHIKELKKSLIKILKNRLKFIEFAEKYSNEKCCGLLHRYFDFEDFKNYYKQEIERIAKYGR